MKGIHTPGRLGVIGDAGAGAVYRGVLGGSESARVVNMGGRKSGEEQETRREERPQHALRSLCAMNRLRSDVVRPSDRGGWWVVVVLGFLWRSGYG